jgi:hypothetical protein
MIRKRITFANVTSFLALFLALTAGSYAAIKLPANSVGTKQIKAKAVTSAKLGKHAVTSSKLAANAVRGPQIAANAVSGTKIAADAIDASKVKDGSLTGADIDLTALGKVPSAAAADSAAIARVKQVSASGTSRANTGPNPPIDSLTASCDAGLVAVGGGVELGDPSTQSALDSFPNGSSAWSARVENIGVGTPTFAVHVICAPAASTS